MRRQRRRGGRAQQELTRLVLATYGRACWLKLPGCTKVATTKDHIVPYAQGGTDDVTNFRPACRSCNSRRQNKNHGGIIRIVTGPPAAGKTTYIMQHAHPLDVVIDLDRIAQALMPQALPLVNDGAPTKQGVPPLNEGAPWKQEYPPHIRHVAIGARQAAIQRATRLNERVGVWIIHSIPSADQLEEYQRLGWQIISIDPGEEIVNQRISTERSSSLHQVADKWYESEAKRDQQSSRLAPPARDWGV